MRIKESVLASNFTSISNACIMTIFLLIADTIYDDINLFTLSREYIAVIWQGIDRPFLLCIGGYLAGLLFSVVNGLNALHKMIWDQFIGSVILTGIQTVSCYEALSYFFGDSPLLSEWITTTIVVLLASLTWTSIVWYRETKSRKKMLIIANGTTPNNIIGHFSSFPSGSLEIYEWDIEVNGQLAGEDLQAYDLVVLSSDVKQEDRQKIIIQAHLRDIKVILVPDFLTISYGYSELDNCDDMPLFRLKPMRPAPEMVFAKRIFDIVFSTVLIILTGPFMAVAGMAIYLDSPGPIIYTQVRCGQNGRSFRIYKFRTMVNNAERLSGPVFATVNDPRITNVGRFLRATRMDELPQLFNVLSGEMSLVGPRPERPEFVKAFSSKYSHYYLRHLVKPGITGLAQVEGCYNTPIEDKLSFDLIYLRRVSLIYDIYLILKTIKTLLNPKKAQGVDVKAEVLNDLH